MLRATVIYVLARYDGVEAAADEEAAGAKWHNIAVRLCFERNAL